MDSGGTLTERTNDSNYAFNRALNRLSCIYSLGFNVDDLPESRRLPLTITVGQRHVRVVHPAFYMRRTDSAKRESRLLAAFVDPTSADDGTLRALLIPRGGDGSTWSATVQVRLCPTGAPNPNAEIGASVVRHDTVTDHFATSIATTSPSRALMMEKSLDIAPGEFSIVAVAHDVPRGDVWSRRLEASRPDPTKSVAAIAPIAALQSGPAAISKDSTVTTSGFLARDVDEMLDPSSSVSLRSVVCRGAQTKRRIIVERWLEGGSREEFAPMTISETDPPCIEVVDVVSARHLRPGVLNYYVASRIGNEIAAQAQRTLRVGVVPATP